MDKTKDDPNIISLDGGVILNVHKNSIIDSNGNFKFKFDALTQEELMLSYSNGVAVFIAGPSDSLFIRLKADDFEKENYPDFEITGPTAKLSKTIQRFRNFSMPLADNISNDNDVKLPPKEFLATLQPKINKGDSLIRVFAEKNHPPELFFRFAKNDYFYNIANQLVYYMAYRLWHHIPYKYYPDLYDTKMFPVDNDQAIISPGYEDHLNQYVQYRYLSGDSTVSKLWKEKKETEAFALALQNVLKNEKPGLSRDIMYYELLNSRNNNPKTFIALMNRKDIYKGNPVLYEVLLNEKKQLEKPDYAIVNLNNFTKKERNITNNFFPGLLKKYSGKVIYIDFWEVYCAPCLFEFSYAHKLHDVYKGKPVAFVNVCMNSTIEQWRQKIKDLKITGDNYYLNSDQSNIIKDKLHVHSFPTYFLIDKNGNIIDTHPPHPSSGKTLTTMLDKYIAK